MKRFFLFIISLFYSFLIHFVRFVYNTINLFSMPAQSSFIVSVGNISVGGTGKTPMISWLVHRLKKENKVSVVIMAGGIGSRLKPFTNVLPKPLLPFENKTIIETIISNLYNYDLRDINISINQNNKVVKAYLDEAYKNSDIIEKNIIRTGYIWGMGLR